MREVRVTRDPMIREPGETEKTPVPSYHRLLLFATPIVVVLTVLIVWPYFTGELYGGGLVATLLIAVALAMVIATVFPRKGHFGFRFVTFLVGVAFLWYVISEFMISGDDFFGTSRPSHDASPFKALMGFLSIGIPSMVYTVYGRWWVKESDEEELEDESLFDTMFHSFQKGAMWLYQLLHLIALAVLVWRVLEALFR